MKKTKRIDFSVTIGEKLKNCIEKQKKSIKEATYGVIDVSDYNAGEVLAEKILSNNII